MADRNENGHESLTKICSMQMRPFHSKFFGLLIYECHGNLTISFIAALTQCYTVTVFGCLGQISHFDVSIHFFSL